MLIDREDRGIKLRSISVIIPVYNSDKYLAEAIESVLEQSYPPAEIIIVNDGCSDESAAIADSFKPQVMVVHQDNKGTGAARNRGIEFASGEYFAFLDADDIWVHNKLKWQIEIFAEDATVDIVYGHVQQFYSPELPESFKQEVQIRKEFSPAHLSSALLIKRKAFFRVGFFETELATGTDQEWYMRAVDQGLTIVMLSQIVYRRRLHKNNLGRRMKQFENQRLHILKAAIDRRKHDQTK